MRNKIIPYGRQEITEEDIQSVIGVLKSDFLTQGPQIREFEQEFADFVGSKYAIAVSNGTAALHLCVLALGLKQGECVITSPITFAASANCVKYADGDVLFADIQETDFLINPFRIEDIIRENKHKVKGIIPVNFAGKPVDLEHIYKIAKENNLWVIEDACHSPGATYISREGKKINSGSCTHSDLSIFSFHPVKHIAAGEGGMITTNSKSLYERLCQLRSHGMVREQNEFHNSIEEAGGHFEYPGWYMEMQSLGFNYRLTDIQCALGLSQLSRIGESLQKRHNIAKAYHERLREFKFIKYIPEYSEGNAYHLFVILVHDRLKLYNFLKSKGIYCQIHYYPVNLMPYYKKIGNTNNTPIAENYYKNCISLPMYPTLTDEDFVFIIDSLKEFDKLFSK